MDTTYHFIGIGGAGMSALAHILLERGYFVSGLDCFMSSTVSALRSKGAVITIGDEAPLPKNSVVVYSTAIAKDHSSLRRARDLSLPILHRSELLAKIIRNQKPILVTGTHGKTSTAALLTHLMEEVGYNPSFITGGSRVGTSQNGKNGEGEYCVVEADESDGSFLKVHGYGGIITNIDTDHLDFWKSKEALIAGFCTFAKQISNTACFFWHYDDSFLSSHFSEGISFGKDLRSELRIIDYKEKEEGIEFTALFKGHFYRDIFLPLIGTHQMENALAVFGMGLFLGMEEKNIRMAFQTFRGVRRRLEKKGEEKGIRVYDDYAHHPTAIFSTLCALKNHICIKYSRRLVAIVEPHRFSRVQSLKKGFVDALAVADLVIITDIFAAGEKPIPNVTGLCIKEAIPYSHYFAKDKLLEGVLPLLYPGDIVITLGAGSITHLGPSLLRELK